MSNFERVIKWINMAGFQAMGIIKKRKIKRGELPIGVTPHRLKYKAGCSKGTRKEQIYLGLYDTPEDAFMAYKQFKEEYIKEVANQYKEKIPKEIYKALINYKVEITD